MAEISAWRANDVVAFELMRESATTLTALLLRSPKVANANNEVADLRSSVLSVDGHDRAAVAALAASISDRIHELPDLSP